MKNAKFGGDQEAYEEGRLQILTHVRNGKTVDDPHVGQLLPNAMVSFVLQQHC